MIKDELILLFTSLYCGIIFAIVYDAIRIIRNLIKPHFIRVVIEDFIYWICVAYIFFSMLIKKNYGNLRWYPIFGMLLAMAVYEIVVGRKLVLKISKVLEKIIRTLLKPLKKAGKRINIGLHPEDINPVFEALEPEGLSCYFDFSMTAEEAEAVLRRCEEIYRNKQRTW